MCSSDLGMERLGIDPVSEIGVHVAECGFEPFERDDGLHPFGPMDPDPVYNDYLRERGLNSPNPWEENANAGIDENGDLRSGWLMKHANLPANVPEEHSETPYMTGRAIDFMKQAGDAPWLCHLSYIKPHWPYIVPAPYHAMYGSEHVLAPVRSDEERETDHPVFRAYIDSRICRTMSRDEVRARVIPAYMGLVKQIDDQLGRLFSWMEEAGLMDSTLIAFTSDHGDYLGDHWMGEKDLFHDQSVKVPLIVCDPRAEADATRGLARDELVECIDLAPTFLRYFGGPELPHVMEGRTLDPLLHSAGRPADWRRHAISEYDYATREARQLIGNAQEDARLVMIRDARWKYVHAEGFRPMLFDLEADPQELRDLGDSPDPEHARVREALREGIFAWARRHHNRFTLDPATIERMTGGEPPGVLIGFWDEEEFESVFGKPFAERP